MAHPDARRRSRDRDLTPNFFELLLFLGDNALSFGFRLFQLGAGFGNDRSCSNLLVSMSASLPPIKAELLVRYGLFPENLRSVFTTRAIWPQLPPMTASYAVTRKSVGELCTYDASKRGGQRRIFGIPHPL